MQRIPSTWLTGILALSLLSACATTQPDWIRGKSAAYPDAAFLTGVGADQQRSQAEDRARAEIAKIFQVNIQSKESISESSLLTKLGKVSSEEYSQHATSALETTTDKLLRGVQIVALANDEKSGTVYALAALDRAQAARALREKLATIDATVVRHVTSAAESTSPLLRLAHYLQAIVANKERAAVATDLRIVDPAGWASPAKYRQGELVAAAETAARAISVTIVLTGDDQQIVATAIVRALNDIGMTVVSTGANVTLTGRITLEEYQRDAMDWAITSAQVEFITAQGERLATLRTKVREASQVKNLAATLAYEKLGDQLAGSLVHSIGKISR